MSDIWVPRKTAILAVFRDAKAEMNSTFAPLIKHLRACRGGPSLARTGTSRFFEVPIWVSSKNGHCRFAPRVAYRALAWFWSRIKRLRGLCLIAVSAPCNALDMPPAMAMGMPYGRAHAAMAAQKKSTHSMPQPLRRSTMGPMQGGRAPADARSPDYSDGIKPSAMQRLDMRDNTPLGMLLIDQLETFHGRHTHGQAWEIEGWYGGDTNKLWVQTEGSRQQAVYEEASVSALWNHALSSYWNTQLGIRRDFAKDSKRSWLGIGLQGLAPYWFELEPMLYLSPKGQVAARLRGSYDLFLTQRLILQPEVEINVSAKNDPHRRIGSGLTDMQFGLRLRYEIRRQFAPYLGLKWLRRFGATADAARQDHQPVFDRQVIAGIRMWF